MDPWKFFLRNPCENFLWKVMNEILADFKKSENTWWNNLSKCQCSSDF